MKKKCKKMGQTAFYVSCLRPCLFPFGLPELGLLSHEYKKFKNFLFASEENLC